MSQKSPRKFNCDNCDYHSSNKKDYNKHLATQKHALVTGIVTELGEIPTKEYKCDCGKVYKYRQNLYTHRKKCIKKINNVDECEIDYKEMLLVTLKQNKELQDYLVKQGEQYQKTINEIIPKIGNNTINNNNTVNQFNLNFFLNEQCKNAITMDQFLSNISVSLPNLMYTKQKGLAEGLSNIFIENLNKLPINERPIHCTDIKRETIYIKNEQWEKDENKTQTKEAIKKLSCIQIKNLKKFKEANPDVMENSKLKDDYMLLIKATTDSLENREDKVIRNLCKNVYIKND